jgi:hypothetical protein
MQHHDAACVCGAHSRAAIQHRILPPATAAEISATSASVQTIATATALQPRIP